MVREVLLLLMQMGFMIWLGYLGFRLGRQLVCSKDKQLNYLAVFIIMMAVIRVGVDFDNWLTNILIK